MRPVRAENRLFSIARSAQAQERQDDQDHDDQAYDVDQGMHDTSSR